MSVEIVTVNTCKKHLVVELPADLVEQEVERLAREYARDAKVPGFRPGKVPLNIIRQRFGDDLRHDVEQELIRRSWREAMQEHRLNPLAGPQVEEMTNDPGAPFRFTLSFEVFPEFGLKDYKGVSVTVPAESLEENEVDEAIEALRERSAEFIPVEDLPVQDGHYVTLTLRGEFEGGGKPIVEDDVVCIVGAPQTEEAFSENLRGARLGEKREFEVSYPADHRRAALAGKRVLYAATVKEIKEKRLPELNHDFAKDIGAQDLEDLRVQVRNEMVTKLERDAEKKAREAVLDEIVGRHSFDVPECLVQDQLEEHARRIASNLARQGIDVTKTSIDWRKVFVEERPHAEAAVRRSIVLKAVAAAEGLEVPDQEIDAELERVAEGTPRSAAALRAKLEKDEQLHSFREHLLHKKALDFIHRNANISRG